jgi:amidohydrolase
MNTIAARARQLVGELLPRIRELRHTLHQAPEIALAEHATAALLRKTLSTTSLRLLPPFLETDVVGLLDGARPGPNVTLRADIDALPIEERTGRAYASRNPGMMHACGHDGHMAMLVGAAMVLQKLSADLAGTVRFVFQPGEEMRAAAKDLIAAGALKDPKPAMVFALHGWPGVPMGVIGGKAGPSLAAADDFRITVRGKGGHGSMPHLAVNPISVAARIVAQLHAIPAERMSAFDPVVVSVCTIHGGKSANVIPEQLELEGTARYHAGVKSGVIRAHIERIVRGECEAAGAAYDLKCDAVYIPTVNDERAVNIGREVARGWLGEACWRDIPLPSMGSEDFAYYLQEHPGAILRLGMGEESPSLHSPDFDFNDEALANGILFLVGCVVERLRME